MFSLLGVVLTACNPVLNWREVQLEQLTVLLPCKPNHAQRSVSLGTLETSLQMVGCDSASVLYAVSHVHITDPAQLAAVQVAWQQATMVNMKANDVQKRYIAVPRTAVGIRQLATNGHGSLHAGELELVVARGISPDGSTVNANLIWFVKGLDIYQVAAYGKTLDRERVDLLFSDWKLP